MESNNNNNSGGGGEKVDSIISSQHTSRRPEEGKFHGFDGAVEEEGDKSLREYETRDMAQHTRRAARPYIVPFGIVKWLGHDDESCLFLLSVLTCANDDLEEFVTPFPL
jgi:hypothetical protein